MVRGVRRRASDLLALSEMIQDALDHGGLGDESHHAHLASAARTHEGVDFVHPADHLRPSAPEGRAVRRARRARRPSCVCPGPHSNRSRNSGPNGAFRPDLHQNAGHELHRVHPLAFGRLDLVMPSLVQVDDLARAGREAEPGEAHRGAHHVADQRLENPSPLEQPGGQRVVEVAGRMPAQMA